MELPVASTDDRADVTPFPPLHPAMNLGLYGDVLEAVITRIPTIDLISASRVSPEWRCAVRSSLCRHPRLLPWLLVRDLRRTNSPLSSVFAFDPFSSSWVSLPPNSTSSQTKPDGRITFLRGSSGDRLHALSVSKMVISEDPFGTVWREEMKAPKVWRQDAVVAEVGRWIVVAGGGCPMVLDDEEVVGAVEVYDKHTGAWESAEPMPAQFDGSTSVTWVSAASFDKQLYIMEKKTGLVSSFDPKSNRWGSTCQQNPDPTVQSWAIAIGRDNTVLVVGVELVCTLGIKVKFWEVNSETMQIVDGTSEEMPREMVQQLFPMEDEDDAQWPCSFPVEVCGTEHGGYVYNPSEMQNGAVLYEIAEEKGRIVRRWEWVPLPERAGRSGFGRIEFGCSAVRLGDLAAFSTN